MTVEVRAVDENGTLVSVVEGVNVTGVRSALNGEESCDLSIPTLHPDATHLDLFESEVQLWVDGDLYGWFRPARTDASREGQTDELRVTCAGLFDYFFDEVVGGERPNHIVSPHEDAAAVGAAPASWTATAGVEAAAIVDNNAEFWQTPKAIQLNNSEAGEDAYIYQRFTVPSGLSGVPFAARATVYVAEGDGVGANPPAYEGAAYNERGLVLLRLDSTATTVLSKSLVARITDETPRNQPVRLQTPEVLPAEGEIIEVRCYSPGAWVVWRHVALLDGRWEGVDRQDKSQAVVALVDHAQDTAVGKQDRNIGTDVVSLGETVSVQWPWWRRDVIGEQLEGLADTFEFAMDYPTLTAGSAVRNVKVRATIGTDLSGSVTLTKEDFVGWGLGAELGTSASRVIRQGEGSGVARDEWWTDDPLALNGNNVERLTFGAPGESQQSLRDNAEEELARLSKIEKLPRARIVGDLAVSIRPGDTVAVNLTHGWAQFVGDARVTAVDLDPAARAALLHLEAV